MDIVPGLGMAKAIRPLQDYHPLAPQLGQPRVSYAPAHMRCNVSPTRRIAARRHARILDAAPIARPRPEAGEKFLPQQQRG
jgi:hypothetical protein